MKKNFLLLIGGIVLCGILFCSREKKETEITPREEVQAITPQEGVAISPEQLAAQLMPELLDLQNQIQAAPQDVEIRKALVACAMDTVRHVVRAVGQGKPPENAKSPAMARQFMDRAAQVDGYRWIAYILAWHEHPEAPDFGHISGEIPPARLVYLDHSSENQAVALVEADASH